MSILGVLLGFGLPGCGGDEADPLADEMRGDEAVTETTADPMEGLQLSVGMERLEFEPGESVAVSLQLSNRSDAPRTLSFRSAQRFDLLLMTEDGEIVSRWSDEMSFAQVLGEERLEPGGEGPLWSAEWAAPQDPGSYRLEAIVSPAEGELRMGVPIEVRDG